MPGAGDHALCWRHRGLHCFCQSRFWFWSVVGLTQLQLYKALAAGKLARFAVITSGRSRWQQWHKAKAEEKEEPEGIGE
jgi:hypothetical protein